MSEAIGCAHVSKSFGDVVANRDVSLSVARGTIHAVIGENGAGKSTLMRALYGMAPPDEGEVRIFGERVRRPSVVESIKRGVGMVHQHFMLVPTLTVAENVMLGREVVKGPFLDGEAAARQLEELSRKYGLALDPRRLVGDLSVGEEQRVEIIKVLWRGAEVLILDEPTAVLTPREVEELFAVLRGLARAGKTVVLVTHKLDEVIALCDRVTVMRRGQVVKELVIEGEGASAAELAHAMVGRDVIATESRARPPVDAGAKTLLTVEDLRQGRLDGVSFSVRAGEIFGIAGVEGNGQSELALLLSGVIKPAAGRVIVDGKVAHVPEDRHARGLVLSMSLEDNLMLGRDGKYARAGLLDRARLRVDARAVVERLDVRPPDPEAIVTRLSGGNQQKVVVGRELHDSPAVLVCAQPTRGVDVGAIEKIHEELLAVRARGGAIVLISAELDELLALADRIAVLYRGKFVGEVARGASREQIGAMMLGAAV